MRTSLICIFGMRLPVLVGPVHHCKVFITQLARGVVRVNFEQNLFKILFILLFYSAPKKNLLHSSSCWCRIEAV